MTFAKIVGDLIQGYSVKISCIVAAIYVGSEVKDLLTHAFDPITKAFGGS